MRILISRTDNIGDVVLTLPIAGVLKRMYPNCFIGFLGKAYTKPLVEATVNIDLFIDWQQIENHSIAEQTAELRKLQFDTVIHVFPNKQIARLAKTAGITTRIGTSHRIFHWFNCNRLINLGRRNSVLHESQLNLKLLEPLGIRTNYSLTEIPDLYGFSRFVELSRATQTLLETKKKKIVIHPKSKGSGREWGLDNFAALIDCLPADQFQIFVTGTESEATQMSSFLSKYDHRLINLCGQLSLAELVSFISKTDALVAASTGPLHIAAACDVFAIGIFPPIKPMHPARWSPVGRRTHVFVREGECNKCRKKPDNCECIKNIKPTDIGNIIIAKLIENKT